jgi:hypothetical protein
LNPVEGAPASAAPKVPARKAEPAPDSLEQYATQNDAWSGTLGGLLESRILAGLDTLGPGGRMEIDLAARGQIGVNALFGLKAKATVERADDGVVVKLGGGLAGGLGAALPGLGDASIAVVVDGGLTYRFQSGKEAADALAAMIQGASMAAAATPMGLPLAPIAQLASDGDALLRVGRSVRRLESLEGALKIEAAARASLPAGIGKLDLMASMAGSPLGFRLDLARGALVVEASFEANLKAAFWYQVVPGLKVGSLNTAGDLKGRYSLEAHYPLSRQDIARVLEGQVKIGDILADPSRQLAFQARAKLTGQLAGAEFEAEKSMPIQELVDLTKVPELLISPGDWTFKGYRLGVAVGGGPKVGLSEVRGTLRTDTLVLDPSLWPAGSPEEANP